ncbi:winged helix-turn-helix transcriptional regulator [Marinobacter xestospongiae]|uniref:Helix-turn-helix domain-containing protein n=1 Tax=Marinobacter xestospongiae TaxID=994319 RepID=A0ABU3W032_9GAMM|nr:helix-turn-helix domain-containing protein [Marinobacter xestospongiae]MDV2079905.1 helix-turn-helix domain-containing protein [Marinobacter xestospongiae]
MDELSYCDPNKSEGQSSLPCDGPCPIERGMRLIGGKWTGSILWHLKDRPLRFNDLSRQIPAASRNMLNERLKYMEEKKLICRTVISERPIAVQYEITAFGSTALGFLDQIHLWAVEHDI